MSGLARRQKRQRPAGSSMPESVSPTSASCSKPSRPSARHRFGNQSRTKVSRLSTGTSGNAAPQGASTIRTTSRWRTSAITSSQPRAAVQRLPAARAAPASNRSFPTYVAGMDGPRTSAPLPHSHSAFSGGAPAALSAGAVSAACSTIWASLNNIRQGRAAGSRETNGVIERPFTQAVP